MALLGKGKRARDEGTHFHSMIALSFLLHAVFISIILFSPSTPSSPRWTFGPVHTVDLVSLSDELFSPSAGGESTVKVSERIGVVTRKSTGRTRSVVRKDVDSSLAVPLKTIKKREPVVSRSSEVEKAIESIKKKVDTTGEETPAPPAARERVAEAPSAGREQGSAGPAGVRQAGVESRTQGSGETGTSTRMQVYYAVVWSQIKGKWTLPKSILPSNDLVAVVSASVLRNGTITNITFEQSSGNRYFDESVVKAVKKADPLPALPEWYRGGSLDIGIRFHSSEMQ